MMRHFFITTVFVLVYTLSVTAQKIGVGADMMYNFQSEGFGSGARVSFFPNNTLSIVPEFSYYFKFNKVNEYYAGAALEYKIIKRKKIFGYLILHGAYNKWISYKESPMLNPKPNNWDLEGGGGISGTKCWRPFLEYRYNIRFRETHLRLGILYIWGCKAKKWGFGADKERCGNYD
jgi:hypothetical protein